MAKHKEFNTTFDPETHIGKVDGIIYPSVTQLISEFKLVDYSMVPPDRLEYKRVLGSAVDLACDLWERDNLDLDSLHPDIMPYFNAYRRFREIDDFEIDQEKTMQRYWSRKWRYHGQADLVGTRNGENVIIDRKCTWVLYQSGHCQTAAYKNLIHENCKGFRIKRTFLLQLNPNGSYTLEECKQSTEFLQDFFACLRMHWRRREVYKTMKGVEI